jgi:hypothetical protein
MKRKSKIYGNLSVNLLYSSKQAKINFKPPNGVKSTQSLRKAKKELEYSLLKKNNGLSWRKL